MTGMTGMTEPHDGDGGAADPDRGAPFSAQWLAETLAVMVELDLAQRGWLDLP
jgi:hypothetical protein